MKCNFVHVKKENNIERVILESKSEKCETFIIGKSNCISVHFYPGSGSCVWGCSPDNV
jgi:hypothetical protein